LTDRINQVTGTMETDGEQERVLDVDSGPGFDEQGYVGFVQTAAVGTVAWAKTFADGLTLTADLNDKVVSRAFPGLGYFYIQEPGRECGIRVNSESLAMTVNPGDVVSIQSDPYFWPAVMSTVDGERVVNPISITTGTPVAAPKRLGINNRGTGGGAFNVYTPGPTGGAGLNNVGLLVRVWGKVISTSPGYFYLEDGSAVTDGTGTAGIRVVGAYGYMPDVNDYVAATGISGLATLATNRARVLRLASSCDIISVSVTPHPTNPRAISTGSGKIGIYWDGVPGVTGYNVYRGLTSGGENYASPVNGSTPITVPTYTGGNVYMLTDSGLTNGTEYFYTVKAIGPLGLSNPSAEVSETPSADAVPWDSEDPYAITSAIQSQLPVTVDYIRAAGPDGQIYDSWQSAALPPDGQVIAGTSLARMSSGQIIPLPNDQGEFYSSSGGMGGMAPVPLGHSDGPYRRVLSKESFTVNQQTVDVAGAQGDFYLPDANAIRLASGTRDTPYIYLGHDKPGVANTDAGVKYLGQPTYDWIVFHASRLASNQWRYDQTHIINFAFRGRRNFLGGQTAWMYYRILQGVGATVVIVAAWNGLWESELVCLANAYPAKQRTARVKRAHSIAQGAPPDVYRKTNSHIWGEAVDHMLLRDTQHYGYDWTNVVTYEEGCYPPPSTGIVTWNPVTPFVKETEIDLSTEYTYP